LRRLPAKQSRRDADRGEQKANQKSIANLPDRGLRPRTAPANKCGPGQPPGPRCSWTSGVPFHRERGEVLETRIPGGTPAVQRTLRPSAREAPEPHELQEPALSAEPHRNLTAASKTPTRAVVVLCVSSSAAATSSSCSLVQKLWRIRITCGSHWKRPMKF
jgi:hypothetical protein